MLSSMKKSIGVHTGCILSLSEPKSKMRRQLKVLVKEEALDVKPQ